MFKTILQARHRNWTVTAGRRQSVDTLRLSAFMSSWKTTPQPSIR